jgi:hypothetical protein
VKDGDSLPDGAIPLPPGLPMTVSQVTAPPPTPVPAPTTNAAESPAPPSKSDGWSFLNFFHHSDQNQPPPDQNQK